VQKTEVGQQPLVARCWKQWQEHWAKEYVQASAQVEWKRQAAVVDSQSEAARLLSGLADDEPGSGSQTTELFGGAEEEPQADWLAQGCVQCWHEVFGQQKEEVLAQAQN
jgi:hypothetical protein